MYDNAYNDGPIWHAFGLSYAAYLVVPRRALQSMPQEWQQRMVDLMNEAHDRLPPEALAGNYTVTLKVNGRFACDPMAEYRHAGPLPARDHTDLVSQKYQGPPNLSVPSWIDDSDPPALRAHDDSRLARG